MGSLGLPAWTRNGNAETISQNWAEKTTKKWDPRNLNIKTPKHVNCSQDVCQKTSAAGVLLGSKYLSHLETAKKVAKPGLGTRKHPKFTNQQAESKSHKPCLLHSSKGSLIINQRSQMFQNVNDFSMLVLRYVKDKISGHRFAGF